MKKKSGYSLAETMVVMMIVSVFLIATVPVITKAKPKTATQQGVDDTGNCVLTELAASFNFTAGTMGGTPSPSCKSAIDSCAANNQSVCDTIKTYTASGTYTAAQNTAAEKVLRASCDAGGNGACQYYVDKCNADSTKCNITGNSSEKDYLDFHYYMTLATTDANLGRPKVKAQAAPYYASGAGGIPTGVHNACDATNPSTACELIGSECDKGTTHACNYFSWGCAAHDYLCDVANSNFDADYYLLKPPSDPNPGRKLIYDHTMATTYDLYSYTRDFGVHAVCNSDDANKNSTACKIVRDKCDAGSANACNYLVDRCRGGYCTNDTDYDLEYYMKLVDTTSNAATALLIPRVKTYYNSDSNAAGTWGNSDLSHSINDYCFAKDDSIACKLIKDHCDAGNQSAGDYFVQACIWGKCDLSTNRDEHYYLSQPIGTAGCAQLVKNGAAWHWGQGTAQIVNHVNTVCPVTCGGTNIACEVKGATGTCAPTTPCGWVTACNDGSYGGACAQAATSGYQKSCLQYKTSCPTTTDGVYTLVTDDGTKYSTYCTMAQGWTLVMKSAGSANFSYNNAYWTNDVTINPGNPYATEYKSLAFTYTPFTNISMIFYHPGPSNSMVTGTTTSTTLKNAIATARVFATGQTGNYNTEFTNNNPSGGGLPNCAMDTFAASRKTGYAQGVPIYTRLGAAETCGYSSYVDAYSNYTDWSVSAFGMGLKDDGSPCSSQSYLPITGSFSASMRSGTVNSVGVSQCNYKTLNNGVNEIEIYVK